jgi:hypothetical protein
MNSRFLKFFLLGASLAGLLAAQVVPGGTAPLYAGSPNYLAPFTGAKAGTQQAYNQRSMSVFDFMTPVQIADVKAKTKTQDVTAAIQAAFAYVPDGVAINFPAGTYKVSGSSPIIRTLSGDINCEVGELVDANASTVGADAIFRFQGSAAAGYVQVAPISAGDITITIAAGLASDLAATPTGGVGCVLGLSSSVAHGGDGSTWHGFGSTMWNGEMVEVVELAGNVVRLKNPTFDSYTASQVGAYLITPVTVNLRGLNIVGNHYTPDSNHPQGAVSFQYGLNCAVEGGNFRGFTFYNVQFAYCLNPRGTGVRMSESYVAAAGYSYGFALDSSQSSRISGCHIDGGRHAIKDGGWEPGRDARVWDCYLDNDPRNTCWCVDSHANCDQISIENCTIMNGVTFLAQNWSIKGCKITARNNPGVYTYLTAAPGYINSRFEILDNDIAMPSNGGTSQAAINVNGTGTIQDMIVVGNKLNGMATPFLVTINNGGGSLTIANLHLDDNKGQLAYTGSGYFAYLQGVSVVNFFADRDRITNNATASAAFIAFGTTATVSYFHCRDFDFVSTANAYPFGIPTTAGAIDVEISGGHSKNPGTYHTFNLYASRFIRLTDVCIEGATSGSGSWNWNAPLLELRNNRFPSAAVTPVITGKAYHTMLPNGTNVIGAGSAMPTSGSWTTGDVFQNLAPTNAAGQVGYWLRVTTGSGNVLNTDWRAAGVTQ